MVTKRDYNSLEIEAAKSVLIELMHLLGEYREDIVIGLFLGLGNYNILSIIITHILISF